MKKQTQCCARVRVVYVMISTPAEATQVSPFIPWAGLLRCTCPSFARAHEYVKAYPPSRSDAGPHVLPHLSLIYALYALTSAKHAPYQTILTANALGRLVSHVHGQAPLRPFHSRSSPLPQIEFLRGRWFPEFLAPGEPYRMGGGPYGRGFPWKRKRGKAVERREEARRGKNRQGKRDGHVFPPSAQLYCVGAECSVTSNSSPFHAGIG